MPKSHFVLRGTPSTTLLLFTSHCSPEELALFTEFAELARAASGNGSGSCSERGAAASAEPAGSCAAPGVKQEPAAEAAAASADAEGEPAEPCGVKPPESPEVRPEGNPAAAGSRSSVDGGSSSSRVEEPLQRQGSEARSCEAQQPVVVGQPGCLVQQARTGAAFPQPDQQQQPDEEREGPARKKQRCEQGILAPSGRQAQQLPQPAEMQAWVQQQQQQLVQHAAGQQVPMAAMPVSALPPAVLHHMAALQQQAAAAVKAAGAASSSAAASPAAGSSPTAAAGAAVPGPVPCFAMPPVPGMLPVMLPPAVAVAMQRQLAAAQQVAGSRLPCGLPMMMPAVASQWAPPVAASSSVQAGAQGE